MLLCYLVNFEQMTEEEENCSGKYISAFLYNCNILTYSPLFDFFVFFHFCATKCFIMFIFNNIHIVYLMLGRKIFTQ